MYGVERTVAATRRPFSRVVGHELVVAVGAVILIQFVQLYQVDQLRGIRGIGSIAGRLQSPGPAFIVGQRQLEKACIALVLNEELAMVLETFLRIGVCPETFIAGIVVEIDGAPLPSVAFDAEMVVPLCGKTAPSRPTLEDSLRQRYTGRYLIAQHLLDGQVAILVNIGLILAVPGHLLRRSKQGLHAKGHAQNGFLDHFSFHILGTKIRRSD